MAQLNMEISARLLAMLVDSMGDSEDGADRAVRCKLVTSVADTFPDTWANELRLVREVLTRHKIYCGSPDNGETAAAVETEMARSEAQQHVIDGVLAALPAEIDRIPRTTLAQSRGHFVPGMVRELADIAAQRLVSLTAANEEMEKLRAPTAIDYGGGSLTIPEGVTQAVFDERGVTFYTGTPSSDYTMEVCGAVSPEGTMCNLRPGHYMTLHSWDKVLPQGMWQQDRDLLPGEITKLAKIGLTRVPGVPPEPEHGEGGTPGS